MGPLAMTELHLGSFLALPVRPRPCAGEATIGYLTRVADANAHGSLRQLFSALPEEGVSRAEQALRLLVLDDNDRTMLYGPLPAAWGGGTLPLGLSVAHFNGVLRRWCPACLAEGGFFHWHWTLKLMVVCLRHGAWLHDICSACNLPQRWGPAGLDRCECGHKLCRQALVEAPAWVLPVARGIVADGLSGDLFTRLSSCDWHRLVLYVGGFSCTSTPVRPGQVAGLHTLRVAADQIRRTAGLLDLWPARFQELLRHLQQQAIRQPSLQQTFHPLYRVIYKELRGRCFDFLRDAFEAYLHENWWGLVCRRNRRLPDRLRATHPRMTVPQAAAAARVSRALADRLIQTELIGVEAAVLPSGRTVRTLHLDDAARLSALATGNLSLQDAARALSLPERRVRQMVESGLIDPLVSRRSSPSAASWVISHAAIAPMLVLPSATASDRSISVRRFLRYGHLAEAEAVEFMRSVVAGRLCGEALLPARMPLGQVQLSENTLTVWLSGLRQSVGQALSLESAAKRLRLKQQVVYGLARARMLATRHDGNGVRRTYAADIEAFERTYVSLAELARASGVSSTAMLRRLPVLPVCGPTVDGSRQYFFRRSDVTIDPMTKSLGIHAGAQRNEE